MIELLPQLDHVASLTFVGTTPGDDDLPPMTEEFLASTAENPDTTDTAAVVDFVVGSIKAYCGDSPYFDTAATRALAAQDVARARDIAATLVNHFLIDFAGPVGGGFGDITAPTLVVHGELDPVFPLPHGEALRAAIPGAELLVLDKAWHEVPAPLWDVFISALVRHTSG